MIPLSCSLSWRSVRWEAYSNFGSILPGTNIVAFKVPLRPGIQKNVADDVAVWGLQELQQALPALSLVVDLTATARYYDPHQLSGGRHCKVEYDCIGFVRSSNHKVLS